MKPHAAYTAEDMPSRKLETYVRRGLESGIGIESGAIAKILFEIASREEKVPLRLPLGSTAFKLIKSNLEARLEDLEAVKELSAVD